MKLFTDNKMLRFFAKILFIGLILFSFAGSGNAALWESEQASAAAVALNTTHRTDTTGADHSAFIAANVDIVDAGVIITATEVEGALQEHRLAINLNTAKVTNVSTALSTGTVDGTSYGITSDGGADDVVLAQADTTNAGVLSAAKWNEIVANTAKATNVSTNLSEGTSTETTVDVNSSDGSNATLAAASTSRAGLLTKAKFDEIVANTAKATNVPTALSVGTNTTTVLAITSDGGADDVTIPLASTTLTGVINSATFDAIGLNTAKATNVPTALSMGTVGVAAIAITSDGGADDVTLPAATNAAAGVVTAAQITKLEGIETSADVTDVTNVTAAGALMDSEVTNLSQVKAFDSSDYATSTQGSTADSALQNIVEDTTPQLAADLDGQGNYAVDLQNFPDMLAGGPGYWFDGVDDYVSVADDDNLDVGTNDFTLLTVCKPHKMTDGGIITKYSANINRWSFDLRADGSIRFYAEVGGVGKGNYTTTAVVYSVDKSVVLGFVSDRDGVKGQFYANGKTISTTEATELAADTLSNSGNFFVGKQSTTYNNFTSYKNLLFNLALTAAEVKAFSNGAAIPYKYLGASQTSLVTGTFESGVESWTGNNATVTQSADQAHGGSNSLKVVQTAAFGEARNSITTIPGKLYRINLWHYDGNTDGRVRVGVSAGDATLLNIAITSDGGTWTEKEGTFTATTTTTHIAFRPSSATVTTYFDDFSVTQIGCVLDLNPSSVGKNNWLDVSGNKLHGVVSGAIPTNLPANHIQKYINLIVTGNGSFTLPQGYKIDSIIAKETAGNALTGGLDVGLTTNGVEVVSGMAIGGSATVVCTLVEAGTIGGTLTTADDIIYFSDGDDDGNWNSASLELTVTMKRIY